ncbi:MAG: GNAT family N-acetyltransferase [Pseudomonadota bacterium]
MNPSNYEIRRARLPDAAALAACIDAAYARYAARISDLPAVSDGCAEDIAENQVWVAVCGNDVVAGLVLVPDDRFLKLANVAVHPDHGGRGLGRVLVEHANAEASRQGYRELRLRTHVDMPDNLRFYAGLGWEEIERRENTVTMRKQL